MTVLEEGAQVISELIPVSRYWRRDYDMDGDMETPELMLTQSLTLARQDTTNIYYLLSTSFASKFP